MHKLKVRFAPSPTGPLHIGGARSALFNYLFARHEGADMILRIEDTDLERSRPEYEEEIITSLRWLGLSWQEGIDVGGENGPYRQTERLEIYSSYARQLLDSGQAYYCFCSQEELESERQALLEQGEMPRYSGKCRHLSAEQRQEKLDQGLVPTVRFQVPGRKLYLLDDLVRGRVSFESDNSGDFIIIKSDGLPTYNFAVVIDDVMMGISHVIRAEEHLSNTPRQLMLYDALNFKRPEFAHISLILGSDRQKMSKRHGATSLVQYRDMGYLPEAMFNFLVLMGWSPEGEQELLTPDEAIKAFTLERVSKSPAVFDLDKLNWLNQQYLKKMDIPALGEALRPFLEKSVYSDQVKSLGQEGLDLLLKAVHDRLVCLADIEEYLALIFSDSVYEEAAWPVLEQETSGPVLHAFLETFPDLTGPDEAGAFIKGLIKSLKVKPAQVYMPLRCALTGRTHGVELPYLMAIWGREETLRRLQATLDKLGK
ncbi:MAG TPA: glutamate--tRNA ligase [Syntrophomonadaceae bacterium]|nr:glutamate--tRNA ligase [Syntrophomonadaceae bacterium]